MLKNTFKGIFLIMFSYVKIMGHNKLIHQSLGVDNRNKTLIFLIRNKIHFSYTHF